eukprot:CAMPEP_0169079172 /NCGR_PEP_ID=MMETSP1015-20121227/9804_1 /TAXON_ID=342587 /ORGANISM="Karlodinium micrum, Strain CCMP2283" /LENGTH=352 /DNA_ID=CAMNT_0009138813 /DNA_START=32 /DNA_END=1090 /DNA_ORIENTATION=+
MAEVTEVNINAADGSMLTKLGGVGGGLRNKILQLRPFSSWEDFQERTSLTDGKLATVRSREKLGKDGRPIVAVLGPPFDPWVTPTGPAASDEDSAQEVADGMLRHRSRYKMDLFDPSWFQSEMYYNVTQDQSDIDEYYAEFEGNVPDYASLSALLQRNRRFGNRSKMLMSWFDRHPDGTVKCAYTGIDLSDASGALLQEANEEHCVPQSYQASKEAKTGRDVFDMYLTSKSANGHRSNRPFGVGTELIRSTESGDYFRLDGFRQELFCPRFNKGACARSTLYIMVAYPGALDRARVPELFLPWLVDTAAREPVTLWEKHRNMVGFSHQFNRNPFTDHPEWARAVDFSAAWAN